MVENKHKKKFSPSKQLEFL